MLKQIGMSCMIKISFSAQSHTGKIRENNEDNLYCAGAVIKPEASNDAFTLSGQLTAPCVFAICDGMGGQEEGEFASFAVASGLAELEAKIKAVAPNKIDNLVQEYVTKTNDIICAKMREKSIRIGTTLALIIITNGTIKPYNIGDSRIYALEDGKLKQISEDHNLTSQKVKMGVLTQEQARHDRDRNKLTRYLGIFEDEMVIEAESLPALPLTEHRRVLLCSDGLTDMVTDSRVEEILQATTTHNAAELLVKEALEQGGKDNVTCIVIDIVPPTASSISKLPGKITRLFTGITRRIGNKHYKKA